MTYIAFNILIYVLSLIGIINLLFIIKKEGLFTVTNVQVCPHVLGVLGACYIKVS